MKGKRYKAEIREKDNQKIEVLLRNWSHKSRTKDYKEEEEAMWLIYPKKHEAKELIYKAHWGSGSHLHIKRTVEEIKKLGYWWDKMEKDVREMYFNCEICAGRTKKPKKKMAYKHIDSYYPKERYQADTVYLSDYLVTDKRYILTMVDHFSKYGWIVVMSDKKAVTVLRAIKLCFVTHGKPESFHTDNGSEFVNETLKTYLEKSGIHHIRGSPYHPQSQGAVEAFNRTVQNFLYLAKDMNGDNFELEDSIIDFLLHYNNRVHSTTKFSPYEIMEKRSEKLIMDKVRENTLNSRKTNKIEEFKLGQVVFVSKK